MTEIIGVLALLVFSYLLGSIPFGLLIAKKFYQTDIRQLGSGNTGATNVWRSLGTKPGAVTLALDIVKGVLPVCLARLFFPQQYGAQTAVGFAAICGHNWSVFLNGSGGKGVATSAGVFLALMPAEAGLSLLGFLIGFFTTRHVSVGSMIGAVVLMVCSLYFDNPSLFRVLTILAGIMILAKHVPNMKRLAHGEEPKVRL